MKLIKQKDGTFQIEQMSKSELEAVRFLTRFFLHASEFGGHFVGKVQRIREALQEVK